MPYFFEHQKKDYSSVGLSNDDGSITEFKKALELLWKRRKSFGLTSVYFEDEDNSEQQFFKFNLNTIQAGKYIGSIKFGEQQFHIIPKIFQDDHSKNEDHEYIEQSNRTILWWLSKCTKINFPKSFSAWSTQNFDFLDILIHLFASLTRDDLIFNQHQAYIEKEEEIEMLRGRIDFGKYSTNFYTGKAHILPCVYDTLEINNLYNQIIKYTAKLLLQNTSNESLKKTLFEIIWILDEVDDKYCTSNECERVVVSPLNDNMQTIVNYCKMFLSGMSVKSEKEDLEIFAFLIPTEKIFEDFLFGFIKDEFENKTGIINILSQGNKFGEQKPLAEHIYNDGSVTMSFRLKPDIYIHKTDKDLILDSKYKVIYSKEESYENDRSKSGVSISDVYQMLAYTVKLDVKTCHLLYPPSLNTEIPLSGYYEIKHHNNLDRSKIYYHRLSTVITDTKSNLKELTKKQEDKLKGELKNIICE